MIRRFEASNESDHPLEGRPAFKYPPNDHLRFKPSLPYLAAATHHSRT